jgi:hypothetical protein
LELASIEPLIVALTALHDRLHFRVLNNAPMLSPDGDKRYKGRKFDIRNRIRRVDEV